MEFPLLISSQQVINSAASHSSGLPVEPQGGSGAWGWSWGSSPPLMCLIAFSSGDRKNSISWIWVPPRASSQGLWGTGTLMYPRTTGSCRGSKELQRCRAQLICLRLTLFQQQGEIWSFWQIKNLKVYWIPKGGTWDGTVFLLGRISYVICKPHGISWQSQYFSPHTASESLSRLHALPV